VSGFSVSTSRVRSTQVKKGRHRRFEEARALKRTTEPRVEPCPECGAMPGDDHAAWCLHDEVETDEADDEAGEAGEEK